MKFPDEIVEKTREIMVCTCDACVSHIEDIYKKLHGIPEHSEGPREATGYKNFDIDIAIKDGGVCARQTISCKDCHVGLSLGRNGDEYCDHSVVLQIALLIKKFL